MNLHEFRPSGGQTVGQGGQRVGSPLAEEVLPVATRCGSALSLVLRTACTASVRMLGSGRHLDETHLPNLHARIERDRQRCDVGEFERDVPIEPGVDEPRCRVDDQSQPTEARLAVDPRHQVVGDCDALEGGTQHELSGVKHEHAVFRDRHQFGQVFLSLLDVDDCRGVVAEDTEQIADLHVDRRGLNAPFVERFDDDAARLDLLAHAPVGKDHERHASARPVAGERLPPDSSVRLPTPAVTRSIMPMGEPLLPPSLGVGARPGWYPDPWGPVNLRWWDGRAWTVNVAQPSRRRIPAWLSVPVIVGLILVVPIAVFAAVMNPWPFLFSLIPVALVAPCLLWADRIEPEPRPAKLHAFLWGATIAVVVAAAGGMWVYLLAGETVATVVGAPVIEETMKGLAVVWALRRREIDGVMDGLIYAGWAGLGFAVVEDFTYFIGASADGSLAGVVIVRALLTPFAHPLFTLWIGVALGRAVVAGRAWFPSVLWGWVVAVALHAGWNGAIVVSTRTDSAGLLALAGAVFVGILTATGLMVVVVRANEKHRLMSALRPLAQAYSLRPDQVAPFSDWRELIRARRRLTRTERRNFDRRHAVLARLAALHARRDGIDPVDEARLRAELTQVFGEH